jgi:hypothetical protein
MVYNISSRQKQRISLLEVPTTEQYFNLAYPITNPHMDLPEITEFSLSDRFIESELRNLKEGKKYNSEWLRQQSRRVVLAEGVTKSLKSKEDVPILVSVQHLFHGKAGNVYVPDISRNVIEIPGIYLGLEMPEDHKDTPLVKSRCKVNIFTDEQADQLKAAIRDMKFHDGKEDFQGDLIVWSPWQLMRGHQQGKIEADF